MIDFLMKKKEHLIEIRSELLCQSSEPQGLGGLRRSVNLQIKLSVLDEELALVEKQIQDCISGGRSLYAVKASPEPLSAVVH